MWFCGYFRLCLGTVLSLKLSPNLRKIPKLDEKFSSQAEEENKRKENEVEKLNKIIEVTRKDRELMDR